MYAFISAQHKVYGFSLQIFTHTQDAEGEHILSALSIVSNVIQIVWIVLAHIVLLNVLIAMMNKTYSDIYEQQKAKAEAEAKAERDAQRARMAAKRAAFEK